MPKSKTLKTHDPQQRASGVDTSVSMILCNEEEYVLAALESIYHFAYEIIIVEGSVKLYSHAANADGSSKDSTLQLIQNFPDPENKIFIMQGLWDNKAEMKQAAWNQMSGNYYMIVDGDEIYLKDDLRLLEETVKENPQTTWFAYPHKHFWQNFRTITTGGVWDTIHPRYCKRSPHYKYNVDHPHGHTTLFDKKRGRFIIPIKGKADTLPVDIECYHYGYVKAPTNILAKEKFYEKRRGVEDYTYHNWTPGTPTKNGGKALPYKGVHPEVMLEHPYYSLTSEEIKKKTQPFQLDRILIVREKQKTTQQEDTGKIIIDDQGRILQKATPDQIDAMRRKIAENKKKEIGKTLKGKSSSKYLRETIHPTGVGGAKGAFQYTQRQAPASAKTSLQRGALLDLTVTLVVLHYGPDELIVQFLKSFLSETHYGKLKLVIVNNNPTKITELITPYLVPHIPTKIVNNEVNVGFAKGCNQGVELSDSELVCVMNNDLTVSNPEWLNELVGTIDGMDNVGMVGCKLIYPPTQKRVFEGKPAANTIQHAGVYFDLSRSEVHSIHRHRYADVNSPKVNSQEELPSLTGACNLFKKSIYTTMGGYDEAFQFGYCEDTDFALRLRTEGFKLMYCPGAELFHYESASFPTFGRGRYLVMRKQNQKILDERWKDSPLLLDAPIERKQIGIVTNWRPQGIGYVAKAFRKALMTKYDIHIWSRKSDVDDPEWRINNITFGDGSSRSTRRITAWAKKLELDLVIFIEINAWSLVKALTAAGIKVASQMVSDTSRTHAAVLSKEHLSAIFTPTRFGAKAHRDHGFGDNVYSYHHPLDVSEFAKYMKPKPKRGPSERIIFFHNAGWGGWDKRKNTTLVAEAYAMLNPGYRERSRMLIHIQNDPSEYGRRFEALIKNNHGIEISQGTVSREEINRMTGEADVAVLPSKWEGLGFPFLESMTCGVPVITVDASPMNELVTHRYNGLLTRCVLKRRTRMSGWICKEAEADVRAVAQAMRDCIDDHALVAKMSRNSIQYIKKNYDEKNTAADFIKLIERKVGV